MNTQTKKVGDYSLDTLKNIFNDIGSSIELEDRIREIISYGSSMHTPPTEKDFQNLRRSDRQEALDKALEKYAREKAVWDTYQEFISDEAKRALMRIKAGYGFGVLPSKSTAALIKATDRKVQICGLFILNQEYAEADVISAQEDELVEP